MDWSDNSLLTLIHKFKDLEDRIQHLIGEGDDADFMDLKTADREMHKTLEEILEFDTKTSFENRQKVEFVVGQLKRAVENVGVVKTLIDSLTFEASKSFDGQNVPWAEASRRIGKR